MIKEYTSLGLMSGTSGDGVDASIIRSDGESKYNVILDKFYEYEDKIYENIHYLKDKICNQKDLIKHSMELLELERNITLFHAKIINEINENDKIDLVGFHGQTIYHNSEEKISKQIGDAKLLCQLTKKNIVYNFRQNDLLNGGEGAPLTPIFHHLLINQNHFDTPICILNIGGISNITIINGLNKKNFIKSKDIGPGNCLIDNWVRKNSTKKFDKDGNLASIGVCNEIIFEQAQELFSQYLNGKKTTFDVNDFDVSFVRGLSLEDGAATLTEITAKSISSSLNNLTSSILKKNLKILICGGGRLNSFLIKKIKNDLSDKIKIELIDDYKINGDFIESQAFAFLAIRSLLNLPISFPNTTGCNSPTTGGLIVKFK